MPTRFLNSKYMLQAKPNTTRNFTQHPPSAAEKEMKIFSVQYLRVINFDKFLHYSDRQLIWVKSYVSILDEYMMVKIPDAMKWHMHAIVLLAARTNNRIPNDPLYVQNAIKATDPVDLASLIEWGLLEIIEESSNDASNFASKLVPTRKQKRSKDASQLDSKSASKLLHTPEKNLEHPASTEQSRGRAEQSRAETEAAAEHARAHDAPATRTRDASSPALPAAAAYSNFSYSLEIVEQFVCEKKKHADNPRGLAVHLQRTGEDNEQIAVWLAEREAWSEKVRQQETEKAEREEAEAKDLAGYLINQGGIRSVEDSTHLLTAIVYFDQHTPDKLASDYNAKTFRALKKLAPYAVQRIEAAIKDDPSQTYLRHWIDPLTLYLDAGQPS